MNLLDFWLWVLAAAFAVFFFWQHWYFFTHRKPTRIASEFYWERIDKGHWRIIDSYSGRAVGHVEYVEYRKDWTSKIDVEGDARSFYENGFIDPGVAKRRTERLLGLGEVRSAEQ